jgi:hypothetical protein
MSATTLVALTPRERAVLRAVAAGRCRSSSGALTVDGLHFSDQFAARRLGNDGLITMAAGPVALTSVGEALLAAAWAVV